jgi:hypothetical protein
LRVDWWLPKAGDRRSGVWMRKVDKWVLSYS